MKPIQAIPLLLCVFLPLAACNDTPAPGGAPDTPEVAITPDTTAAPSYDSSPEDFAVSRFLTGSEIRWGMTPGEVTTLLEAEFPGHELTIEPPDEDLADSGTRITLSGSIGTPMGTADKATFEFFAIRDEETVAQRGLQALIGERLGNIQFTITDRNHEEIEQTLIEMTGALTYGYSLLYQGDKSVWATRPSIEESPQYYLRPEAALLGNMSQQVQQLYKQRAMVVFDGDEILLEGDRFDAVFESRKRELHMLYFYLAAPAEGSLVGVRLEAAPLAMIELVSGL